MLATVEASSAAAAPPPAAGPVLRNLYEMARLLGVSAPTLKTWCETRNCPVARRGDRGVGWEFDAPAVIAWHKAEQNAEQEELERRAAENRQLTLEVLGRDALSVDGTAPQGGLSSVAKSQAIDAELKALKLSREKGELVRADEMRERMVDAFARIREVVRTLPADLARRFAWGDDETATANDLVDAKLDAIADELEALEASLPPGAR